MARHYSFFMESKVIVSKNVKESSRCALRQNWSAAVPSQNGVAVFSWSSQGLTARVAMSDKSISNNALGPKEKTWELGDVVEFFVKPSGGSQYYEFHVTPHNVLLDLRIESADKVAEAWERRYQYQSLAKSRTMVSEGAWLAHLFVPWSAIGIKPAPGTEFSFAVCRYNYLNYNKNSHNIEYSSTASLTQLNYHRPWEWQVAVLK